MSRREHAQEALPTDYQHVDAASYDEYARAVAIDARLLPMFVASSLVGPTFIAMLDRLFGSYEPSVHVAQRMEIHGAIPSPPYDVAISASIAAAWSSPKATAAQLRYECATVGPAGGAIILESSLLFGVPARPPFRRVGAAPFGIASSVDVSSGRRAATVIEHDAPRRFATLIGDMQPLHLIGAQGTDGRVDHPIVHGLYTLARAATLSLEVNGSEHDVVRGVAGRFVGFLHGGDRLVVRSRACGSDVVFAGSRGAASIVDCGRVKVDDTR